MFRRILALLFLGAAPAIGPAAASGQDLQPGVGERPDVRVAAPLSTKPFAAAIARAMRQEKGLVVAVSTDVTSLDAIDALGQDRADIALITRPLSMRDRDRYPDLDLVVLPIGMQVVALGIADDLWEAGLHAITEENLRAVYEQKITNWKEVGGPDEKITFFSFEQGAGVWEILTAWLYGDNRKAPIPKKEEAVATSADARDDLEFTPGSMAPMFASYIDNARCHAIGLVLGGHVALPTPREVASNTYPVARPVVAVVIGKPTLAIRAVTEFMTGREGQALLKTNGELGLEAVPKPKPTPAH
jgi:phosphate transport system substrate-binding protein